MVANLVGLAGLIGVATVLVTLATQSVAAAATGAELATLAPTGGLGFAAAAGVLVGMVVGRRRASTLQRPASTGDSDAFSYPSGETA